MYFLSYFCMFNDFILVFSYFIGYNNVFSKTITSLDRGHKTQLKSAE